GRSRAIFPRLTISRKTSGWNKLIIRTMTGSSYSFVIPVKTGIQFFQTWTPASAGVTFIFLSAQSDPERFAPYTLGD
ncbi:MAG TPA: hypothetical protein VGL70_24060, partial [Candidatus Binatia bacterium]